MKQWLSTFAYVVWAAIIAAFGVGMYQAGHDAPIIAPVPDKPPAPFVPAMICDVTGKECACGCIQGQECICDIPDYAHIESGCRSQQKNCIVFVGVRPRRVDGFVIASQKTFDGLTFGVVVGVWRNGKFLRFDLPASATDMQIRETLKPKAAASVPATSGMRMVASARGSRRGC